MSQEGHLLYLQIYEHFRDLIKQGKIKPGEKLPSIRRCALERQVSKTTVETSYMQLAAEGYVVAVAGSGYYVSEIGFNVTKKPTLNRLHQEIKEIEPIYDFATSKVDYKSFDFDLWKRYIKSALRNTKRLVAYGDPQGEYDLRVALMNYVREARGVICTPEQIVVGAGVQSLLSIVCSLIDKKSPICFTGTPFKQGRAIFEDRGFDIYYKKEIETDLSYFKEHQIKIIYTFPSHMSIWGEVMPIKKRLSLLKFSEETGHFIIEDDYDSEFRYYVRPVPSLQSLEGGEKVIYIGSFSRLLLPSLRIAFMVLPIELMSRYEERGSLYNQTASTAEQIALCQFIRDGHLKKQIRKTRKLYLSKSSRLCHVIKEVFKEEARAVRGEGDFLVRLEIKSQHSAEELKRRAEKGGIKLKASEDYNKEGWPCLLLSCSGVDETEFLYAMTLLKECFERS